MNNKLYPTLPEGGAEVAQRLMDNFKEEMRKCIDNTLGDLYVDVSVYVESDHWTNYRNVLMDGLKGYENSVTMPYDFKAIRRQMLKENLEDILADINQDLLEENTNLKEQLQQGWAIYK